MNDRKLLELITKIREVCISNFNELSKSTHSEDAEWGVNMVYFMRLPGSSRKINDWGRDEDTDYIIGVSQKGWIEYKTVIQCGAGESELISDEEYQLSDNRILEILNNGSLVQYLEFIAKCYSIVGKYRSEFTKILY